MVHGLLVDCLADWHGAWSTGGLIGLLIWCMGYWWAAWPTGGLLAYWWAACLLVGCLPTGMVHGLLVGCLAYWHGACFTSGLFGLPDMVHGLLVATWHSGVVCGLLEGALPTGGLASMLHSPLAGHVT